MTSAAPFEPTREWKDVPDNAVLPSGLQIEVDLESGRKRARLAPEHDHDRPGETLAPDLNEAVGFLASWPPAETPWVTLVAIYPKTGNHKVPPPQMVTFDLADLDKARSWIASSNGHGNVYFLANTKRRDGRTRKKEDVQLLTCLAVDLDPREAVEAEPGGLGRERARLHALADDLGASPCPPSVAIDSGGGVQLFWRLETPLANEPEWREAAEGLARRISRALGGDSTQSVEHIYRLPGTINHPDKKKLAKGRTTCRARLLHNSGELHTWRDLEALAARLEADPPSNAAPKPTRHRANGNGAAHAPHDGYPDDLDDLPDRVEPATPGDLRCLRLNVPEIEPIWRRDPAYAEEHGFTDTTLSEWDMALANALRSLPAARIWAFLAAFRIEHASHTDAPDKWKRRDYVERTIALARELPPIVDHDAVARRLREAMGGAAHPGQPHAPQPAPAARPPEWDEPLDVLGAAELTGWPELTPDCLPKPLFDYATSEARRINADPVAIACHCIAACSAMISDAWLCQSKRHDPWKQQARVWSCVVKDVGARGSEVIRTAFWPVRRRDQQMREAWRRAFAEWQERQDALAPKDRKAAEKSDPPPKCRRLVSRDATVEAACDMLSEQQGADEHSKLVILADELVGFLGGFGKYTDSGSSTRALWLESFDGGPQSIDRVKKGHVYVPNWSVVVAGNIQPRRLRKIAEDLVEDGLFQRFMTVHARPADPGVDDDLPLDPEAGERYGDLLDTLAALEPLFSFGRGTPLRATDEAAAERQKFLRFVDTITHNAALPVVVRESASKWSGLLARLTMIFHLVEVAEHRMKGGVLDLTHGDGGLLWWLFPKPETVAMATAWLRRIILPNLFRLGYETMAGGDELQGHARWIAGHVLAGRLDRVTAREIGRASRDLRGRRKEIGLTMTALADAGWVTRDGRARHDSQTWLVNPRVHETFGEAAARERARRERIKTLIQQEAERGGANSTQSGFQGNQ